MATTLVSAAALTAALVPELWSAAAGLVLLPQRTAAGLIATHALAWNADCEPRTRALAIQYVAESPVAVDAIPELRCLAETAGDVGVRTAAACALGRLPRTRLAARAAACTAALALVASDSPVEVRIAGLRAAVESRPGFLVRDRVRNLVEDHDAPKALRDDARALLSRTGWRD